MWEPNPITNQKVIRISHNTAENDGNKKSDTPHHFNRNHDTIQNNFKKQFSTPKPTKIVSQSACLKSYENPFNQSSVSDIQNANQKNFNQQKNTSINSSRRKKIETIPIVGKYDYNCDYRGPSENNTKSQTKINSLHQTSFKSWRNRLRNNDFQDDDIPISQFPASQNSKGKFKRSHHNQTEDLFDYEQYQEIFNFGRKIHFPGEKTNSQRPNKKFIDQEEIVPQINIHKQTLLDSDSYNFSSGPDPEISYPYQNNSARRQKLDQSFRQKSGKSSFIQNDQNSLYTKKQDIATDCQILTSSNNNQTNPKITKQISNKQTTQNVSLGISEPIDYCALLNNEHSMLSNTNHSNQNINDKDNRPNLIENTSLQHINSEQHNQLNTVQIPTKTKKSIRKRKRKRKTRKSQTNTEIVNQTNSNQFQNTNQDNTSTEIDNQTNSNQFQNIIQDNIPTEIDNQTNSNQLQNTSQDNIPTENNNQTNSNQLQNIIQENINAILNNPLQTENKVSKEQSSDKRINEQHKPNNEHSNDQNNISQITNKAVNMQSSNQQFTKPRKNKAKKNRKSRKNNKASNFTKIETINNNNSIDMQSQNNQVCDQIKQTDQKTDSIIQDMNEENSQNNNKESQIQSNQNDSSIENNDFIANGKKFKDNLDLSYSNSQSHFSSFDENNSFTDQSLELRPKKLMQNECNINQRAFSKTAGNSICNKSKPLSHTYSLRSQAYFDGNEDETLFSSSNEQSIGPKNFSQQIRKISKNPFDLPVGSSKISNNANDDPFPPPHKFAKTDFKMIQRYKFPHLTTLRGQIVPPNSEMNSEEYREKLNKNKCSSDSDGIIGRDQDIFSKLAHSSYMEQNPSSFLSCEIEADEIRKFKSLLETSNIKAEGDDLEATNFVIAPENSKEDSNYQSLNGDEISDQIRDELIKDFLLDLPSKNKSQSFVSVEIDQKNIEKFDELERDNRIELPNNIFSLSDYDYQSNSSDNTLVFASNSDERPINSDICDNNISGNSNISINSDIYDYTSKLPDGNIMTLNSQPDDIQSKSNQDIQSNSNQDIQSNSSQDIQSNSNQDTSSKSNQDIQSQLQHDDIQLKSNQDTSSKSNQDIQSNSNQDIQSQSQHDDIQLKSNQDFQSNSNQDISSKSRQDIQSKSYHDNIQSKPEYVVSPAKSKKDSIVSNISTHQDNIILTSTSYQLPENQFHLLWEDPSVNAEQFIIIHDGKPIPLCPPPPNTTSPTPQQNSNINGNSMDYAISSSSNILIDKQSLSQTHPPLHKKSNTFCMLSLSSIGPTMDHTISNLNKQDKLFLKLMNKKIKKKRHKTKD